MIKSILDNDLYKFTMQQAVHSLYPRAEVDYVFINRGGTSFPDGFGDRLVCEIKKMEELRLSEAELSYLKESCYFFSPVYLDFLKSYRFMASEVLVRQSGDKLELSVVGPWYRIILWEVPLMAMISELYFSMVTPPLDSPLDRRSKNIQKATLLRDGEVEFADFGTRRRFSSANQDAVLKDIMSVADNTLVGTSNVFFAMKNGLTPIGTHAHEWFMFHACEDGYRLANRMAIGAWTAVYQGNLGIALTDTYTTDAFLLSFDSVYARLFDGVRQDSGDPFVFADKLVAHYKKLKIDPMSKTIVFSDGLNSKTAVEIKQYCKGKIKSSFGIGTHLTNDVGPAALNMVIKLSKCRGDKTKMWMPAVKLSDDKGKNTGLAEEIELCKRTIDTRHN